VFAGSRCRRRTWRRCAAPCCRCCTSGSTPSGIIIIIILIIILIIIILLLIIILLIIIAMSLVWSQPVPSSDVEAVCRAVLPLLHQGLYSKRPATVMYAEQVRRTRTHTRAAAGRG
jgi:hypothetical protein